MAIRIIRTTRMNMALIGLAAFALFMLINALWAHGPLPLAIMGGIIVAVVSVANIPRINAKLLEWEEWKRTGV